MRKKPQKEIVVHKVYYSGSQSTVWGPSGVPEAATGVPVMDTVMDYFACDILTLSAI